jgi:predicted transcriptional regulator
MEIRLPPDLEAQLAAVAASAGRSTAEVVQEAIALWEERQAQQRRDAPNTKHTPARAAARIRELRKGNFLPEGETIKDLINYGRA